LIVAGFIVALAVASETWICQLEKDDADGGYEVTFVVSDDRVIETGLLPYGYELLEDNDEHLTFARSQYNAMLNAGFRQDQVAVVVTIDRSTNAVKKIFLQDHGERTSIQRGSCQRIEV
jgi:hypothetical protein